MRIVICVLIGVVVGVIASVSSNNDYGASDNDMVTPLYMFPLIGLIVGILASIK